MHDVLPEEAEKVPTAQEVQETIALVVESEKAPAGHNEHTVAPETLLKEPVLQAAQEVLIVEAVYLPTGHVRQAL